MLGVMPQTPEVVLRTANVAYLRSRCNAGERRFSEPETLADHTFIVPRTMTTLSFGGTVVTANPTNVLLCNRYQRMLRRPISPMEASDWYVVSDELLYQMVAGHDRRVSYAFPFQIFEAAPTPSALLESRVVADSLVAGLIDASAAEEAILALAAEFVAAAYRNRRGTIATQREVDGIEAVREWIVRHPTDNPSLAELAAIGGITVPRLCRLFRSRTGLTVTRFRHQLRMCLALELMSDNSTVLDVALALGYSSHSHFTYFFRKIFGVAPSQVRKRLASGDAAVREAISESVFA